MLLPHAGTAPASAFAGFWMGGYEGADHVNGHGQPLDMAAASGHIDQLEDDHRRAAEAGLRCVRESIGWRLAEDGDGHIDLTRALRIQASAQRHGLQVLWTLMHYGVPPGLSLHDDAMIPRLARFAAEVARVLGPGSPRPPVYTPVNEIGFLAWAASDTGLLFPPNGPAVAAPGEDTARASGYTVKRRLARAALAAMQAMLQADPRARFLHVEPLVHVVPPADRPDLQPQADLVRGWQWQAWDLLSGRLEPALGGHPALLDIVGVNHYHSSQWELHSNARLDWFGRDPRRAPFSSLVTEAWQRYGRPVMVAETSHVGVGRAAWLHEIACELRHALAAGVPVQGLCVYPLVDRPDWQDAAHWHRSGVWHVDTRSAPASGPAAARAGSDASSAAERPLRRHPEPAVIAALRAWQRVLPWPNPGNATGHEPLGGGQDGRRQGAGTVLVVYSHLRWDFLRHRTRCLVEALVERMPGLRVVVVEEPLQRPGAARLDRQSAGPCIDVLVPHTPVPEPGFGPAQQDTLHGLLAHWLAEQGIAGHLAWLSSPMAWPLAQALQPAHTVLDISDELTGFLGAPAALPHLQAQAVASASLVLAAGPALAAAHAAAAGARLRLVQNGVDARRHRHRRQGCGDWADDEASRVCPALAGPVLGYAGAIDERMDLGLLAAVAAARPDWHIVLVGPVLKIDSTALPRAPNLHWLGQQPAEVIPALMTRWHLAVLPWQLNAATRHAHPLKVLEALAAGLPVVAPALPDLLGWQSEGVQCVPEGPPAAVADGFVAACAKLLAELPPARERRLAAAHALLSRHGWARAAALSARALQKLAVDGGLQVCKTETHSGLRPAVPALPVHALPAATPAEPVEHTLATTLPDRKI